MDQKEQYLQAIRDIRATVVDLIAKEKSIYGEALCQENGAGAAAVDVGPSIAELMLKVDGLFERVINLPGSDASAFQCKLLIVEALEDLRQSFVVQHRARTGSADQSGLHWQAGRAGYLTKIQAAEDFIRSSSFG